LRQTIGLFALAVIWTLLATAQSDKAIYQKEQELQKLREEIQVFESRLRNSEKQERATLDRLDNLEKQSTLIRKLLRSLVSKEQLLTSQIDSARGSIDDLERQLSFLKSHYAGYVSSVYKHARVYDLELLFSSKNLNQLSIRIEYLKRFSDQRAKDLQSIQENKELLEGQYAQLESALEDHRKLLTEKTREQKTLSGKTTERQRMLNRIRKDNKTYRAELDRKNKAAREIQGLIASLIEKERTRRTPGTTASSASPSARAPAVDPAAAAAFAARKGGLRWPVSSTSIASRFGRQVHPVLKTVTQNAGVDIATPFGSDVLAVAGGEVSIIKFIPGYGNVLILDHGGGYRTVYAHLSEIHVTETETVREGHRIGTSGDTIAGDVLHFELWKDRDTQNPELWLSRHR
ncbi:MAG: peptidoglycan DD-metalloendopeptidase family protein, partial [Proteobacteria bacterium]|nr:peptidoglycan DD-metalloendopeptidase family protein [Pseudomonadota bacterium]